MSSPEAYPTNHGRSIAANSGWPPSATVGIVAISMAAWLVMVSGWPGHNSPIADSTYSQAELVLAKAARNICGRPPDKSATFAEMLQWISGWAIMVVAMMLPPAVPFLRTVAEVSGRAKVQLVTLAGIAFVVTWTAAGLLLMSIAGLLASFTLPGSLDHPALLAGTAALTVGAYQFTPMKKACLAACRSPRAVIMCHWNGEQPARSALHSGLRYAAICIGCCWATMALTLIVGVHALPLMVLVSTIMLAERLLPWMRPLVPLQAAFAVLLGILLILGWLPTATSFANS